MMEDVVVSGITMNKNQAKITLCGVPDKPGVAVKLFKDLAVAGVSVDMIVQNVSHTRHTDISFTTSKGDCPKSRKNHPDGGKKRSVPTMCSSTKISPASR